MLHPGEALDHDGDAVQGPQLPSEPVGGGAFQQGLLDGRELVVRQPGVGPLGPRLRSPSVPPALKRPYQTLTACAETSS